MEKKSIRELNLNIKLNTSSALSTGTVKLESNRGVD